MDLIDTKFTFTHKQTIYFVIVTLCL